MTIPSDAAIPSGNFVRQLDDVRSDITQTRTARRGQSTSVGAGGSRYHSGGGITVEDGGDIRISGGGGITIEDDGSITVTDGGDITIEGGQFRLNDANGITVAYFGDVNTGESTARGWIFRFDSGGLAFALGGSAGKQTWGLRDRDENLLVSNDSGSDSGLGRPYLNIPLYPSSGTSVGTGGPFWPQFTNVAYQEVMHGITTLWHPRIRVGVATNNGGSGTVDWQLKIDGVTIGSGSGNGFGTFDVNGWRTTNRPGQQVSVQLWCRNTSGVASRVIPDYCYGLES